MKTNFQALATRLIEGVFGSVSQVVTIRRPIYSNYDEETGSMIQAHEDRDVVAVVGPWRNNSQPGMNSDAIATDDLSVIYSKVRLDIEPELNVDTAILPDGSEWSIVYYEKDEAEASVRLRLAKDLEQ